MKKLTARFIREAGTPGKYYDGDAGLFLIVRSATRKSFMQRLTVRGKRCEIGLGSTRWVTLTEARTAAQENRKLARMGGDPLAAKRPDVPTFADATETVIAIHAEGWKDAGKSAGQWRASLRDYALPRLGRMRVDQITTADVMEVLLPIWQPKHETARRVRQRIGAVMKWAVAQGYRQDNPAGDAIGAALPRNGRAKAHQRALPYQGVSGALEAVKASHAAPATVLAVEFLVLTACRSGEVRQATWAEIDMAAAVWTIPAERMKQRRAHRVPLSGRAMEILREAETYRDASGLIFPSATGRAMSDNTLSKLLRELGIECVPHGFRSSFRDWAAERSNAPREVCELALAHVNSDRVEAAYRRTDLFEKRRDLMERWAGYLSGQDAKVVRLRG
ncbi:MAG: tyrosine-type recombinase/integrase [Rhodospirillaceae bacterium]|nr:tyrosine-type recombinase/integrase [Rhodospirillaceae bacterium]